MPRQLARYSKCTRCEGEPDKSMFISPLGLIPKLIDTRPGAEYNRGIKPKRGDQMIKKYLILSITLLLLLFLFNTFTIAEEQKDDKINIAIMDFKANGMSATESAAFSEIIRDDFINSKHFKVLPRENMDNLLQEQALQQTGCTSEECAIQLGKILNVKKMIVGSISYAFESYIVILKVVDVEKGVADCSIKETVKSKQDLIDALPKSVVKKVIAEYYPDQKTAEADIQKAETKENKYDFEPEMVLIPAGEFEMGSNEYENEQPVHKVNLDAYYIGKYEVTFDEYDHYCETNNKAKPSDSNWGRGRRPVINVSWNDAVAYCEWLSEKTGKKYRLPTEAEWEKAARGGLSGKKYPNGDHLDSTKANYNGSSSGEEYLEKTAPVGSYLANGYGLYDMAGNVWEWCNDWSMNQYSLSSSISNPTGPSSGYNRVLRGGGWDFDGIGRLSLRCASRFSNAPDKGYYYYYGNIGLGFRVARTP